MQSNLSPDALLDGPVPGIPGATIREVSVLPEHLPDSIVIGPYTEAAPGALLFTMPGIARYLVRGGSTVDVAVAPGADRMAAKLFLDTSARGALIHQRGELPLNATAVLSPDGVGVAICGVSGAGKSTLAAALAHRGWFLVADEITRVSWNGSVPIASPSDVSVKLWRDACDMTRLYSDQLRPVRAGLEKYYVPIPSTAEAVPLRAVVALRIGPDCAVIEIPQTQSSEYLSECTFRPRLVAALGRRAAHARILAQVSHGCRIVVLEGARERPIEELADHLSAAIGKIIAG
ncbi:MAG TPA: hypothetical protein VHX61_08645 [Rhizomicrobium sp.]|jgi:hypothetical protein|nr:hypothetical protein [Rhizomicrobium sp.]